MRKTIRLFLLALPMVLGLSSCQGLIDAIIGHEDNPVVDPNPLAGQVSGLWWSLTDQEGSYSDAATTFDYTRLGMALNFNADGTGYGIVFLFNNDESEPIDNIGGEGFGKFTYTTTADGSITMDFSNAGKASQDYFKQWTMSYADGTVSATDGTLTLTLEKPNDIMAVKIHEWDMKMNGGFTMESFNPNDEDFNHDTWRQQPAVYVYDGTGTGEYVKTFNGRQYRFKGLYLPWNTDQTVSNLPMNFCEDITPENGWDLVMNYCGNTGIANCNFFALYNKWTGVMRVFTYMPAGFESSGNDHLWQVTINKQTGMRLGLPYGLPLDKKVVDPSAIGMDTNGSSQFCSPWVDKRSTDGLITPREGWWAFDIDMSQYQPGLDISGDQIRFQMLAWKKEKGTFFSNLTAGIDGSIDAKIKTELTQKASQINKANECVQAVLATGSALGSAATGQAGAAFTSIGSMEDHILTLAGKNESQTTFKGSINMTMKGSLTTNGIISASEPVTEVCMPTISFGKFDTKNTMLGKGVWNLKTSPVVWLTDVGGGFGLRWYWQRNNPDMYYEYHQQSLSIPYYPDGAEFYFFDPSSIEVELNPDLFPASQVEWTQVEAYCVSHVDNGVRGTDNFRKAFGLQPRSAKYFNYSNSGIEDKDASHHEFDTNKNVFDFLYYSNDKWGLDYPAIVCTPKYEGGMMYQNHKANGYYDVVVGRGKAGSVALEPMALRDGRNDVDIWNRLPALEVMVCLKVKVKGQSEPFIYVRHYLPEIKTLPVYRTYWDDDYQTRVLGAMNQVWQNIKARQPKGSGINRQSPTYDYEMERIGKVLNYINSDFKND